MTPNKIKANYNGYKDTDSNTPPPKLISKIILVELLDIREESVILYLWGMNPLAYFSLLFYIETFYYILMYGAQWRLMLDGGSLILNDIIHFLRKKNTTIYPNSKDLPVLSTR